MGGARYEIRVAGVVPEQDLRDMGAVTLSVEQVNTVLYDVPDQAALYGLLARLRALGVDVVEVRRIPGAAPASSESDADHPGEDDDDNS
jgi:hypothetical protein